MNIRFTIIIPLYNKEDYIEKCLVSILNQTYNNFEIIIIDDKSTDSSLKIVKNIIGKYSDDRIKLFKNKKNNGVSFSRNRGLNNSTGEYIIFLDADDEFSGNTLLEKVNYFINIYKPEYIMLNRNYYNKFIKPDFKSDNKNLARLEEKFYEIQNKIDIALEGNFPFGGSASAVINSAALVNKEFDVNESSFEDWYFFLPIYLESKGYYYSEVAVNINYDSKSLSNSKKTTVSYEMPNIYGFLEDNTELSELRKVFFWIFMTGALRNSKSKDIKILYHKYKDLIKKNFILNKYSIYSLIKFNRRFIDYFVQR